MGYEEEYPGADVVSAVEVECDAFTSSEGPGYGDRPAVSLRRLLASRLVEGPAVSVLDGVGVSVSAGSPGAGPVDTDLVEVQCEDCGLVVELLGVSPGVGCDACGGFLVEVESELLVDGSAGVLVDAVIPVDPHVLAGLVDRGDAGAVA